MNVEPLLSNPLFGTGLTLAAYAVGVLLYRKTGVSVLHPVIIASVLIMLILEVFGIPVEAYQQGGRMISFLLGPATVVLAVPLYRQMRILKTHALIIIVSIAVGAVTSMVSVILLSRAFGLPEQLILSLVPKSVTTPIAVDISASLGGSSSITVIAVVITGIFGAVIGPFLLKVLHISDPSARGLALGTASHAIGTSRALELGELDGAISSLSIGLAGIITVFTAPVILVLFGI